MEARRRTPAFRAPPVWPAARKPYLKAIQEKVLRIQGPLRGARGINMSKDAEVKPSANQKGDLVMESSFRYQACDDRECYLPQTTR